MRPYSFSGRLLAATLAVLGPGTLILVRLIAPVRFPLPDLGYAVPALAWLILVLPIAIAGFRYAPTLLSKQMTAAGSAVATFLLLTSTIAVVAHVRFPSAVVAEARAGSQRPNVVIVFLDTVRYDHSGFSGGSKHLAPALAAFGKRGLVYEEAWAPTPWTLSSHLSALTGKTPDQLGVDYDQQNYRDPGSTLAEALRHKGYSTAAVVSNGFLHPGNGFARGYDRFEYSIANLDLCRSSPGFIMRNFGGYVGARPCSWGGDDITERAVRAAASLPRPYFLTLNYMDAHLPYKTDDSCVFSPKTEFRPLRDLPPLDRVNRLNVPFSDPARKRFVERYQAAVRCLDHSVARLLTGLRRSGDLDNTIVVFIGDHGEQFGEHNLTLHGNSVFRQALHVPLAIAGPGVPPGRITAPVSTTWLFHTIREMTAGGDTRPRPDSLPGLGRYEGRRPFILSVHQPARELFTVPPRLGSTAWSVVDDPHHYILAEDGSEALYDFRNDSAEERNLAGDPARAEVRSRLRGVLTRYVTVHGQAPEADRQSKALGYMQ